jgi:hypothetical protein
VRLALQGLGTADKVVCRILGCADKQVRVRVRVRCG